jgi:hypothetical protein
LSRTKGSVSSANSRVSSVKKFWGDFSMALQNENKSHRNLKLRIPYSLFDLTTGVNLVIGKIQRVCTE